MSSRKLDHPEPSPELLKGLAPELREALLGVYRTLDRPVPLGVNYCPCAVCFPGDEMPAILRTPYRDLGHRELYAILFNAFRMWGNWSDLAYYLPRILELAYLENSYIDWEQLLLPRLLEASRTDPQFWKERSRSPQIGKPMSPAERRGLAAFFQAYLAEIVGIT